jgi:hypothetical protein
MAIGWHGRKKVYLGRAKSFARFMALLEKAFCFCRTIQITQVYLQRGSKLNQTASSIKVPTS